MTANKIAVVGAGRMGRGIALSYIFAGVSVVLVDLKQRTGEQKQKLIDDASIELRKDIQFLADMGLVDHRQVEAIISKVSYAHKDDVENPLTGCSVIYEGVPEVMEAKQEAFAYVSEYADKVSIIASTTSTFLVTDLADLVTDPTRFINAHWLNPAHLMPLVELSKGDKTSDNTVVKMRASLESIGKVPVVCSASAGYIVPRIQAIAMNEAARLVEEGVASAEDVDKAVNVGFGLRFAVLGMLEFIDWGGGDILYYASAYLSKAVDPRYTAPDIITFNMKNGKNGIRDGEGFFDYRDMDTDAYRQRRMKDFVSLLRYRNLLPVHNQSLSRDV